MIIDCHGHYTTEPRAHHAFREAQIAFATGIGADPARRVYPRLDALLKQKAL